MVYSSNLKLVGKYYRIEEQARKEYFFVLTAIHRGPPILDIKEINYSFLQGSPKFLFFAIFQSPPDKFK